MRPPLEHLSLLHSLEPVQVVVILNVVPLIAAVQPPVQLFLLVLLVHLHVHYLELTAKLSGGHAASDPCVGGHVDPRLAELDVLELLLVAI